MNELQMFNYVFDQMTNPFKNNGYPFDEEWEEREVRRPISGTHDGPDEE